MAQVERKSGRPITAAQIKRIHTIIHILGVSDENYRAALESRFGVTTCKDLTLMQAKSFIDELEKLASKTDRERWEKKREEAARQFNNNQPKKFDDLDNRPGMASGPMLRKIEAMWQEVSIVPEPAARSRALRHFIKRIAGVADLRFLDIQGAGKVINALNAMQKQTTEPAKAKTPKNAV